MEDFTIQNIDPSQYKTQEYTLQDTNLLTPVNINKEFGLDTDVIEFHIISPSGDILETNYNYKNYKNRNTIDNSSLFDSIEINPEEDLLLYGYQTGQFDLLYNFNRLLFNSSKELPFFIKEISRDRTEIKITNNNIEYLELQSLYIDYIATRNQRTFYSDFLVNFGLNKTIIGVNLALDNINNETPSLYIKLYEPLPLDFNIKDQLWLVETISDSYSFKLNKDVLIDNITNLNPLKGPNFNIEINSRVSLTTPYYNLSTLLDNNLTSSYNQLQSLIKDNVQINIDYNDFTNFIHFSSLRERIDNFIYKLNQINRLTEDLVVLSNVTSSASSTNISSSILTINNQINNITQNFDGYESFLYYESGTNSFPKQNDTRPYINEYPTSSISLVWIGSDDEQSQYYGGKILDASNYDFQNRDNLWGNLPDYIKFDSQNSQLELLISMLGHHFDYIWTYIRDITNKNVNDNRLNYGISKDIVAETLKSFGIKLYTNSQNKENIYSGILGINPDGTFLPSTGSYVINNYITSSNYTIPESDITKELYKRLYHNLPYLLKSKGTKRGLKSLINCFGIPSTILDIKEYGGVIKDSNTINQITNKFNYNLNIDNNVTVFEIPFYPSNKQYLDTGYDDILPDTIEFRFKLNDIIPTQSLLDCDLLGSKHIRIIYDTGSYANIDFGISGSSGWIYSPPINLPLYNDGWWNINLTRETGSIRTIESSSNQKYILYIGNKEGENIEYLRSSSIFINGSTSSSYNSIWNNLGNYIYPGGDGSTYPFSGSIQEFRYWINSIPIDNFKDHILNPKSISFLNETSSYQNLIFRLPLGSELDRIESPLYTVHPNYTSSFISTSFEENNAYIYGETSYIPNYENYLINNPNIGSFTESNIKINLSENNTLSDNTLSPFVSIIKSNIFEKTNNNSKIEIGISPQNTINNDIVEQLGLFNIDSYIGDPRHSSLETYPDLSSLKIFYFQKYINKQNLFDIIKLISYLDNSLFKMIQDFTPARSDLYSGLIIKSHILERNKNGRNEPDLSFHNFDAEIDTAFLTGSNALGTNFNSFNSSSHYSTIGIIDRYNNDNRELYNGELSGSNIQIYDKSNGIVYEKNKLSTNNLDIIENYSEIVLDPILNNISNYVLSKKHFDVDYSSFINIPSNLNYLTSSLKGNYNEIVNAAVQPSNYTSKKHINPRYEGSKLISREYNKYHIGDVANGQVSNINKEANKFAYFEEIYSQSLTLPDRSNVYIKYLIDENSNITELTKQNKNIFEIQNLFSNSNLIDILLDNNMSPSNQRILDGLQDIYAGGYRYAPMLQNIYSPLYSSSNFLEYTFENDIQQLNLYTSSITNNLPNSSIIIGDIKLQSLPSLTPGLNTLTPNILQSTLDSKILVNVTRNTQYLGEINQIISGTISVNFSISPPTNLNSTFYSNNNGTGDSWVVPIGDYPDVRDVPEYTFPVMNNRVHSVRIPYGVEGILFKDPEYGGPTYDIIGNNSLVNVQSGFIFNGLTSMQMRVVSVSSSFNYSNTLNNFGAIPSSSLPIDTYPVSGTNGLSIDMIFPIEGVIVLPENLSNGYIELRNTNNFIGKIKSQLEFLNVGGGRIQFTTQPDISDTSIYRVGSPFIFDSPPDFIYITGTLDYGYNSGSSPSENWFWERGNSLVSGSKYNLLTGSFYISELIYNSTHGRFIQTYPSYSHLGYEDIEDFYLPKTGDLVRFWNYDRDLFPTNFENEIKKIYYPQNVPNSSSYDNRLVIEFKDEIPNQSCLEYFVSGSTSKRIQNFIFLSKIEDETNIVITKNKKQGTTSPGVATPDNITRSLKDKIGNIIKTLKNQNLI